VHVTSININCFEIDCEHEVFFPVQQASAIDKICEGNGWTLPVKEHLTE
jgi:hypothetical protein